MINSRSPVSCYAAVFTEQRRTILKVLALSCAMAVMPVHAEAPVKVVYHLSDGIEQATRALANVRNHLRAAPDTNIVVVALGDGIQFLLKEAIDRKGTPFAPAVDALVQQGVEFRICMNTLAAHEVPLARVITAAKPVPSGVAEIARLQAREGFVYFRP